MLTTVFEIRIYHHGSQLSGYRIFTVAQNRDPKRGIRPNSCFITITITITISYTCVYIHICIHTYIHILIIIIMMIMISRPSNRIKPHFWLTFESLESGLFSGSPSSDPPSGYGDICLIIVIRCRINHVAFICGIY